MNMAAYLDCLGRHTTTMSEAGQVRVASTDTYLNHLGRNRSTVAKVGTMGGRRLMCITPGCNELMLANNFIVCRVSTQSTRVSCT